MPRSANASTVSTQPRKSPSKSSTALTAGAGGTGGGTIAILAQSFREPYRTWFSVLAPIVAAGITAWWPTLVAWKTNRDSLNAAKNEQKKIVAELDKYVKSQQRRLKNDKTLPPHVRDKIKKQIAQAQDARANAEYRLISTFMPGEEPEDLGEISSDTSPKDDESAIR